MFTAILKTTGWDYTAYTWSRLYIYAHNSISKARLGVCFHICLTCIDFGAALGFMSLGRESLRSPYISVTSARSSRTSDDPTSKNESLYTFVPEKKKSLVSHGVIHGILFCRWSLKIVLIRWENRWAEVWPESPAQLPACLLKHHWTQPKRWLHFGFSALSQLPWQMAEQKRSQRSEVRPLILKRHMGTVGILDSESKNQSKFYSTSSKIQRVESLTKSFLILMLKQILIQDALTTDQKFDFTVSQKLACPLQPVCRQSRHRHL